MSVSAPDSGSPQGDVTRLLKELRDGNPTASHQLIPLIYDELRRLASRHLRSESNNITLQTTALVHEVFLKLTAGSAVDFNDRSHFFIVASQAMRQILVDKARARRAQKRGAGAIPLELNENMLSTEDGLHTALVVDEVLTRLEKLDPRQVRIVEMRFYVGLTIKEIAEIFDLSTKTIARDLNAAQAWIHRELEPPPNASPKT